ncbi:hypothetical protein [Streptomyces mutabilis]|uniref:hypothetical protein n=1 Tax=Streptomyces mutabilis TaxID=67332 RepID=UPI0036832FA1
MLLAAWETAAELLPEAVGDPAALSWAAPPALDRLVDLTPLGPNDGGSRSQLAVAIIAAPAMDRAERQRLLREALVHMAYAFGSVDAEVDLL